MATKDDTPPFRVTVERGGRLAPATPYDQERLDSYRPGTVLTMRLTEDTQDPMIKKWWAVLGAVINHCDTPFSNKTAASDYFKVSLGILDFKVIQGQKIVGVGSLKDLSQSERAQIVDQMIGMVEDAYNVDVEALLNEVDATKKSAEPEPTEAKAASAGTGGPPTPAPAETPQFDQRQRLLDFAQDIIWKSCGREKVEASVHNAIIKNWAHDIEKMDDEGKALAREITLGARAIHKDEARIEEILDSLSKLLGVDIQDLDRVAS
jgi:hypothetical protein